MDPEDSDRSEFEPEGLLCAAVTKNGKKKSPYFRRRKRKTPAKKKRKQPKRLQKSSPYFTPKELSDSNDDGVLIMDKQLQGSEEVAATKAIDQCEVKELIEPQDLSACDDQERGKCIDVAISSSRHRHILYPDFSPPQSPYGLVQEQLYKEPWKLLVATIFLNKTTGLAAKPILWEFLRLYPTPEATVAASQKELALLFQPLGLHRKRASGIIRFSEEYLRKDWEYPIELYGIGKYGNDSYRIFCTPEWREVRPSDHWLNKYYAWLCEQNNFHPEDWSP